MADALLLGLVFLFGAGFSPVAVGQSLNLESGPWVLERSGTTAGLRGIHAVGGGIAWASGTNGTILRTEDGGYEWQSCAMPPGAEKLDFRGIWAWDDQTAIAMSSGPGDASRLYETTDGCSHWTLVATNPDRDGFWDAMVFWTRKQALAALGDEEGVLLGDPVRGVFQRFDLRRRGDAIVLSKNLKETPAAPGAAVFAASNSAMALGKWSYRGSSPVVWFGTGGKPGAFVWRLEGVYAEVSEGYPRMASHRWSRVRVPLAGGMESSGVFSLAFRDGTHGVAVGGDYAKPDASAGTAAGSADGGKTWTAAAKPPHGYRSAVAWDADAKAWIAVGPNGSDISYDDGKTWVPLDGADTRGNWNALSLPWVVGPQGRIGKLDPGKLAQGPKP